mgnify:FL=1
MRYTNRTNAFCTTEYNGYAVDYYNPHSNMYFFHIWLLGFVHLRE